MTIDGYLLLYAFAFLCFAAAAVRVAPRRVDLVALGLALWALAAVAARWPS